MSKLKVLIPLDGTETSLYSIQWFKKFFAPNMAEVTLINVIEGLNGKELCSVKELEISLRKSINILSQGEGSLKDYTVKKASALGISSFMILKEAKEGYDMIIIAKSNIKGLIKFVGSVTTKVIRDSHIPVIAVSEYNMKDFSI